jgi:hypothetical protein
VSKKTHLHVRPSNPKACIRDPRSRVKLGQAGGRVPNNPYWRARLRDGDIAELTADEVAAAKQAADAIDKAVAASEKNTEPADKAKKGA